MLLKIDILTRLLLGLFVVMDRNKIINLANKINVSQNPIQNQVQLSLNEVNNFMSEALNETAPSKALDLFSKFNNAPDPVKVALLRMVLEYYIRKFNIQSLIKIDYNGVFGNTNTLIKYY
jgi:hypothetical protein